MTTLDLTQISPKAREFYIRLGRRFSSDDTLKQANKTLEALSTHDGVLDDHGFGADDRARLAEARDALSVAGMGRETKITTQKTTRKDYLAALKQAKTARSKARTILENTLVPLNDAGHDDLVHKVEAILGQTSSLPVTGQDEGLAAQLDVLAGIWTEALVANAAQRRGGDKALTNLQDAATALRATAEEREATGTQMSTEQMDFLDGIIVTSCRSARNAAKQAAKELGRPAMANDFALSHISIDRHHASGTPEAPPAMPAPAPSP
jgi:hypothetical protein